MKSVRITAIRKASYPDLSEKYELPQEIPCMVKEGESWISEEAEKPEGFCSSAWGSISGFVMALACGAEGLYGAWMKNPRSALLSCNDGFRPVSFLLETIAEEDIGEI